MIGPWLARLDKRAHERLDRGGMRMEDADPISMLTARWLVRALDRADRVTGFRAQDRGQGPHAPR